MQKAVTRPRVHRSCKLTTSRQSPSREKVSWALPVALCGARTGAPSDDAPFFRTLCTEVTSHPFCFILFTKSWPRAQTHSRGGRSTQMRLRGWATEGRLGPGHPAEDGRTLLRPASVSRGTGCRPRALAFGHRVQGERSRAVFPGLLGHRSGLEGARASAISGSLGVRRHGHSQIPEVWRPTLSAWAHGRGFYVLP